ncbi:hypothetical protein DL96DRAFT_1627516 [Flagelloscypha sp. PMI_526]|nr:hypothetical protein DL96DRAFT_1627516 [Flagelloscypha sp. PMI_526]
MSDLQLCLIHDFPDELLEPILEIACYRDYEGLTARSISLVCKLWRQIMSPALYRHLAVLPPAIAYYRGLFPSLLETLEDRKDAIDIRCLLIRVFPPHQDQIFKPLAQISHTTLVSLTIWLRASHLSASNFLQSAPAWPVLTHLTIVGDPSDGGYFDSNVNFPSLTHMHIIGSCLWPIFGKAEDYPRLRFFRISMIRYYPYFGKILGSICGAIKNPSREGLNWPSKVKFWEIHHQPEVEYDEVTMGSTHMGSRLWEIHQERVKGTIQEIHSILSQLSDPPSVAFVPMENVPEDVWRMRVGSNEMWNRVLGLLDWVGDTP